MADVPTFKRQYSVSSSSNRQMSGKNLGPVAGSLMVMGGAAKWCRRMTKRSHLDTLDKLRNYALSSETAGPLFARTAIVGPELNPRIRDKADFSACGHY